MVSPTKNGYQRHDMQCMPSMLTQAPPKLEAGYSPRGDKIIDF